MTRILTVALLCAASSLGCSAINSRTAANGCGSCGGQPSHLATSQFAPRPAIERAGYESRMGVCDLQGGCGSSCGGGSLVDADCDFVNDCVGTVLDCNGCGDACGGGCNDGAGACCCGGRGECACCQRLRQWWSNNCACNAAGKCACCCKMRAVVATARNAVCDPRAAVTDANYNFNQGPSSAQVAYPYYTTRGPRDYFLNNPPSIGPY